MAITAAITETSPRCSQEWAGPSVANLEEARELSTAVASGQELGDLFEYKLKDRVTLKKNQSALVPIAQTEIDAEKVSPLERDNRIGTSSARTVVEEHQPADAGWRKLQRAGKRGVCRRGTNGPD